MEAFTFASDARAVAKECAKEAPLVATDPLRKGMAEALVSEHRATVAHRDPLPDEGNRLLPGHHTDVQGTERSGVAEDSTGLVLGAAVCGN
jgi:hypothetical protein